jgi:hypothetical protein
MTKKPLTVMLREDSAWAQVYVKLAELNIAGGSIEGTDREFLAAVVERLGTVANAISNKESAEGLLSTLILLAAEIMSWLEAPER